MIRRHHFLYLPSHRLVFAYVPKAACTNWKAVLRHLSGYADYLDSAIAHDRQRNGLQSLAEVANWQEILDSAAIRKYAFVRNPFTRVLSAYLNKIEPYALGDGGWQRPYFASVYAAVDDYRRRELPEEPRVSLAVFLRWLADSGDPLTEDEHWLPQERILCPPLVRYDFVGRFERLAEDAATLLRRMGATVPFPTREALEFPGTHADRQVGTYYGESEAALVRRIYADDFTAFGYSPRLPDGG